MRLMQKYNESPMIEMCECECWNSYVLNVFLCFSDARLFFRLLFQHFIFLVFLLLLFAVNQLWLHRYLCDWCIRNNIHWEKIFLLICLYFQLYLELCVNGRRFTYQFTRSIGYHEWYNCSVDFLTFALYFYLRSHTFQLFFISRFFAIEHVLTLRQKNSFHFLFVCSKHLWNEEFSFKHIHPIPMNPGTKNIMHWCKRSLLRLK